MKTLLMTLTLVVSMTLFSAAHATILIDDFQTTQVTTKLYDPGTTYSTAAASEALGGTRDIELRLVDDTGAPSFNGAFSGADVGFFTHNTDSLIKAYSIITWDGDSDATTVDTDGLLGLYPAGVDMTEAGYNNAFDFGITTANPVAFTITVYDKDGGSGTATKFLPAGIQKIWFNEFAWTGTDATALTRVGALSVQVSQGLIADEDATFSFFTAEVPEPNALALMLLSCCGFLGLRRRRN